MHITATDEAGNESLPTTVAIYMQDDSAAACQAPEATCSDGSCSIGGVCLPAADSGTGRSHTNFAGDGGAGAASLIGGGSPANSSVYVYVPPVDSDAPEITVTTSGSDKVTFEPVTGEVFVETFVLLGAVYHDQSATAWDPVEGDLSSRIPQYGLAAVSTSAPTPPGKPHIIKYDVTVRLADLQPRARLSADILPPSGSAASVTMHK